MNLILPTVLISFLCVLVFYLPAEAGEKVTLGISILLSLVVFLLLVSKILPPTSLVLPLIAKYLLFTFIMNTVSILVTVIIINWNFRGPRTHRMPQLIRKIFLKYLPTILLMRRPKKTRLRCVTHFRKTFYDTLKRLDDREQLFSSSIFHFIIIISTFFYFATLQEIYRNFYPKFLDVFHIL